MNRILIVRLGAMGDIVHTLPALATLRRAFPEARIDWAVERRWAPLLAGNRRLSALRVLDAEDWRKAPGSTRTWRAVARFAAALREARYDVALDFQGLLKSAIVAGLSGAPRVLGFARQDLREPLAALCYTGSARPAGGGHVVERNLNLAAHVGATEPVLEFECEPASQDVQTVRGTIGDAAGYIVINPGAGWAAKRWPEEAYAGLIVQLYKNLGRRTVMNCGPGEEPIAGRVSKLAAEARPLALQPSVGELIALVRGAALVIGGDTGPVHLAAACGTPVVALFGPTDPVRNRPLGAPARILRAPEAATNYSRSAPRDAVRAIAVEEVYAAAAELLTTATDAPVLPPLRLTPPPG